ncbi:MAG TPA: M23 family metallopeptidase [bacterium]|nr:M23 family metallopeptidase [bacterium]
MEGMRAMRVLAAVVLAAFLAAGCAHVYTAHGAYYRVRKGDTLEEVAKRYRTDVQDLAEVNNIESSKELRVGSSLYIPGLTPNRLASLLKKEGVSVPSASKKEQKEAKNEKTEKKEKHPKGGKNAPEEGTEAVAEAEEDSGVKTERGKFIWPLEGDVSSLFGMRHGRKHDGVDISAKTGTPVYAAADGDVVFAKKMRGYGNLVLLKHKDDFFTVYAHNSVNLVKLGTKVKKGQMVSRVGRTGRATGPHLHFEVREGPKARNPLFFLPKNMYAERAKDRKDDGPNLEGEEAEPEVADASGPDAPAALEPPPAAEELPKSTKPAAKTTAKSTKKAAPKASKTVKASKPVKSSKPSKTVKTAKSPQGVKRGKTEAKNP